MSTKPTPLALLFIAITILFTVVGQFFVKRGMMELGSSPTQLLLLPKFIFRSFFNIYIIIWLVCGLTAAVAWAMALSRCPLNVAFPFTGLTLVLGIAITPMALGEIVPWTRWFGVAIVCIGIWVSTLR